MVESMDPKDLDLVRRDPKAGGLRGVMLGQLLGVVVGGMATQDHAAFIAVNAQIADAPAQPLLEPSFYSGQVVEHRRHLVHHLHLRGQGQGRADRETPRGFYPECRFFVVSVSVSKLCANGSQGKGFTPAARYLRDFGAAAHSRLRELRDWIPWRLSTGLHWTTGCAALTQLRSEVGVDPTSAESRGVKDVCGFVE